MKVPPGKMTTDEFNAWLDQERDRLYRREGNQLVCKTCGTPTEAIRCFVSIHSKDFGDSCAGFGEVKHVALDYCPKCETVPTETVTSCVHV